MRLSPRKILNPIAENCFPIFQFGILRLIWVLKCRGERQLAAGKNPSISDKQSILFFTVHRCASVFMSRLLRELTSHSDMKHADFDAYFALQQIPVSDGFKRNGFVTTAFHKQGYIYGPMRSFRSIPEINEYKKLLILRDPRDVLVSKYFSDAFSHVPMSRSFRDLRNTARDRGIDAHVLAEASYFRDRYVDYSKLLNQPEVLFCKFREIMEDPRSFLEKIQNFVDIQLPDERVDRIVGKDLAPVKSENVFRHKRAAKAGAFREKLKPETIDHLNDILAEPLRLFGFDAR